MQSFFAAVKSRKAELLSRVAVWFNCSRWEGMVTASPCPARAMIVSVCEEVRERAELCDEWLWFKSVLGRSLPCQPVRGSAVRADG